MLRNSIFVVLLCILCSSAFAGMQIDFEHREVGEQEAQKGKMSLGKHMFKMESEKPDADATDMIFRGDQELIWIVDHDSKSYMRMDKQMMKQMASMMQGQGKPDMSEMQAQMDKAMKAMEESLKELPEEQRKMAEQMMKQRMPKMPPPSEAGEMRVKATKESKKISGHECTRYDIMVGETKKSEIWATDWKNVSADRESLAPLQELSSFLKELVQEMPQLAGHMDNMTAFSALDEIDKCPIFILEFEDGKPSDEFMLKSFLEVDLNDSDFAPPVGYDLKQNFGM